jgi:hypothetical protein
MAGKATTKEPAKAPTKSAEKAAPAAAPAAAEQLDNQPAAPTTSEAPGSDAGSSGQEAHPPVTLNGLEIASYLEGLLAGATGLVPLSKLDEPLLRQVGQFVEIEGFAELPPEQLAIQIEAKVGIGAAVTPAPSTAAPDTTPAAPDTAAATSQPASAAPQASVGDAAAPGSDQLDDDGDIEGLWVTAIPEQGFRRCGFRFTREGFGIALDALTAEQIEQLENEPNLKVERGIFSVRVGERVY